MLLPIWSSTSCRNSWVDCSAQCLLPYSWLLPQYRLVSPGRFLMISSQWAYSIGLLSAWVNLYWAWVPELSVRTFPESWDSIDFWECVGSSSVSFLWARLNSLWGVLNANFWSCCMLAMCRTPVSEIPHYSTWSEPIPMRDRKSDLLWVSSLIRVSSVQQCETQQPLKRSQCLSDLIPLDGGALFKSDWCCIPRSCHNILCSKSSAVPYNAFAGIHPQNVTNEAEHHQLTSNQLPATLPKDDWSSMKS